VVHGPGELERLGDAVVGQRPRVPFEQPGGGRVERGGADAVLCASIFHYGRYRIGARVARVVGDEDQLSLGAGEFNRADYAIARLQPDDIPRVSAEHLRIDSLHDPLRRAECQAERILGQRCQAEHLLIAGESDQLTDMSTTLEVRCMSGGGDCWEIERRDLDQPAGAGHKSTVAASGRDDLGHDEVVVGPRTHWR
jgi:hypothetical protein